MTRQTLKPRRSRAKYQTTAIAVNACANTSPCTPVAYVQSASPRNGSACTTMAMITTAAQIALSERLATAGDCERALERPSTRGSRPSRPSEKR